MELADGLLLIAASGIGAICGILGQSIREWLSRPRINIMASADDKNVVLLYFVNAGRRSTEDLAVDVVSYDGNVLAGGARSIFHSTDMTIHPRTAYILSFGRIDGDVLRIKRSDFGKILKFTDDLDEGSEEWVFPLPAELYVSACAKDTTASVKILTADRNGAHVKNPKKISYGALKKQSPSDGAGTE